MFTYTSLGRCNLQEGLTPLMLATQKGNESVVKLLLDGKVNPNIADKVNTASFSFELIASYSPHLCLQTTGWSALFFAAKQGNVKIARLLVEKSANVELKDKVRCLLRSH